MGNLAHRTPPGTKRMVSIRERVPTSLPGAENRWVLSPRPGAPATNPLEVLMDHQEPGTTDGAAPPRRQLQIARETLRQLGARTLRNAVGGTFYTWGPPDCDYSQNNPAECFT